MFVLETCGGVVLMVHPAVRILRCCGSLGDVDALADRLAGIQRGDYDLPAIARRARHTVETHFNQSRLHDQLAARLV